MRIPSGDRLILAGDILDVLGGRSYFVRKHRGIFETLSALAARGVKIDWIEGNHDFHLKPKLEQVVHGLTVHLESIAIGPLFVAHGDTADIQDLAYQRWRRRSRSWLGSLFFRKMPSRFLDWLGHKMSRWSKAESWQPERMQQWGEHTQRTRDAMRNFARQKFDAGYTAVVLGHVHVQDEMQIKHNMYMNIGFPPVHGTIVVWDSMDGTLSRFPLSP